MAASNAPFIEMEVTTSGPCNASVQELLVNATKAQLLALAPASASAGDATAAVSVVAEPCTEVRVSGYLCLGTGVVFKPLGCRQQLSDSSGRFILGGAALVVLVLVLRVLVGLIGGARRCRAVPHAAREICHLSSSP
jgi:hypothetical protein